MTTTFDLIDTVLASTADLGVAGLTIDAQTITFADGSWLAWTATDTAWSMTPFTPDDVVIDQDADVTLTTLADRVLARARQMS